MQDKLQNSDYLSLFKDIKERVARAQYAALRAVNRELIVLYQDIGRMIVERQKGDTWGKSVVERLAKDLQTSFPGIQGFSARNIWRMRDFYQTYRVNRKLSPLVTEISWSHNLIILTRCKTDAEREFYITMTKKFGWSKNVLNLQIDSKAYEKTRDGQTNFHATLPEQARAHAALAVKDEYTFDFLELGDAHLEQDLERALVGNIRKFLLEMGGYFCFIGNQYRIEVAGSEYFVDLLLYHRRLKCLVAVELKIGDFKPEFAGKMQFYLSALNDRVKLDDENPSIGIIICRGKKRTVVEYALKDVNKPIGVSTYKIISELPKKLSKYLPSPDQLTRNMDLLGEEGSRPGK